MRILQINSVCGIGSTGRIATDIHQILMEQGHESYIAYGRGEPRNCENTIKIGSKLDVYGHVAKTRIMDLHGFGSKQSTIQFIQKIKELDPDIIHLHNIHGYYINIEVLFEYLKVADKPIVWTLHDCWAFMGHCAYFDYVGCDKWIDGCNKCPQKKEYPASWFLDNSSENYKNKKRIFSGVKNLTIITPSVWLANLVNNSFLNEYSVKTINNGIDLSVFKPTIGNFRSKYNITNKFMILGVANIWERRKGLNFFLELSNIISKDEIIVLVGLNEKQIKNMPNNIIGISRTSNLLELVEIYSSANVYVNPTLEDNFPTTNLESLACGTPVITFKTGGSPESITQLVGDVALHAITNDLYMAIKRERDNPRLSANCVNRAHLFDKNLKFNEYLQIYDENIHN